MLAPVAPESRSVSRFPSGQFHEDKAISKLTCLPVGPKIDGLGQGMRSYCTEVCRNDSSRAQS